MNEPTTALTTLVSLAGLWILLFWLYRDYCVDKFRQEVFTLRDELFDAARTGQLDFNHASYGLLRSTMNGFIRFAHRFTLLHALLITFITRNEIERDTPESFPFRWKASTSSLTQQQMELVSRYRSRMNILVIRHLLRSSPILVLTAVVPILGWIALRLCLSQLLGALSRPLDGIDSAAMAEGHQA